MNGFGLPAKKKIMTNTSRYWKCLILTHFYDNIVEKNDEDSSDAATAAYFRSLLFLFAMMIKLDNDNWEGGGREGA